MINDWSRSRRLQRGLKAPWLWQEHGEKYKMKNGMLSLLKSIVDESKIRAVGGARSLMYLLDTDIRPFYPVDKLYLN